jgi:hypothetical protein
MSNGIAPWDELRYFDLPVETLHSAPGNSTTIVNADTRRVVLVVSNNGAATVTMSVALSPAMRQGISLTVSIPVVWLTAREHPWLCQSAWTLTSGGGAGANITVLEVFLREWPSKSATAMQSANRRALRSSRPRANSDADVSRFSSTLRRLWDALPGLHSDPQ